MELKFINKNEVKILTLNELGIDQGAKERKLIQLLKDGYKPANKIALNIVTRYGLNCLIKN